MALYHGSRKRSLLWRSLGKSGTAASRRLGRTIDAAKCDLPKTKDEAYAIQDAIVQLSGLHRRGYKVGSTSKEAQRLLSTNKPGTGPLLGPYLHASPAHITIAPAQMRAIEGEFVFRLGRDLPSRPETYTMSEVVTAIDGVAGAIEVVGTRFSGGLGGKGRLLTTDDCGVNIASEAQKPTCRNASCRFVP
jgi:2-keto-4-pentenoate hydratase